MDAIKVVVIEDNEYIRAIIRATLEEEPDIHICDEAENLEKARECLAKWRPDIALVDIMVDEEEGGLKLLSEVSGQNLPINFIVISAFEEFLYSEKCLKAGAKGYVCKDKTVQCLAEAIRRVHGGKTYISKRMFLEPQL